MTEVTTDGVGGLDDEPTVTELDLATANVTSILVEIRTGAKRKVKSTFDPELDLDRAHFFRRGITVLRGALDRIADGDDADLDDIERSLVIKSMQSLVAGLAVAEVGDD